MIVERFKFYSRIRKEGESVAKFVSELRNLSRHCSFANKLDDQIRDKLVCGINNLQIQRKLLSEGSELSLDRATKVALSMEAANRQVLELGANGKKSVMGVGL